MVSKKILLTIPETQGVYFIYHPTLNGFLRLEYVGKSKNLRQRAEYHRVHRFLTNKFLPIPLPRLTFEEIGKVEEELILTHQPRNNRNFNKNAHGWEFEPWERDYLKETFLLLWGEEI